MKKVLIVALTAMLASSASATLLVYEGFDYTAPGGNTLVGNNGGTGFTGAWGATWDPLNSFGLGSGSLSYGALLTTGNSAVSSDWGTDAGADDTSRTLTAWSTADGTSVWVSYLVNFTDPTVASHGTGSQWDGIKFTGGDLWFGNNAASANWGMELPALSSSTPMTTGTHLVVAQIEYAAGVQNKYMWIDPSVASLNGGNLAQSDALLSQLGQVKSTANGLYLAATKAGVMDEIRVATNFADVTPIPEPASILLLVSGILGAYKLRRRS